MKNFMKTLTATAALLAVSMPATAQTSDSTVIEVQANVVAANVPLSITAPASINLGEVKIPVSPNNTCLYSSGYGSSVVTDQSGLSGTNPEPTICINTITPEASSAIVECEPDLLVNFTNSGVTTAAAAAAGLEFKPVMGFDGTDLLINNANTVTFSLTCPQNGMMDAGSGYGLLVPGTAQPFNGSVGEITIDVAY